MNRELVVKVCLAVREGRGQQANDGFKEILTQTDEKFILEAVCDCLLVAYRRQQRKLAHSWLMLAWEHLMSSMSSLDLTQQAVVFLQRIAFVVCDRRIIEARPALEALLLRFMHVHRTDAVMTAFWDELLSLAARMARRNWREEARFLLRILLRDLLMQKQKKVIFSRLMQIQMHFIAYARWDGFNNACAAYRELIYFYLLLVRRAGKDGFNTIQQQDFLLLAMRSMRDIIANVSRLAMQDDMDIFRQLYQFFWQMAGDDKKCKQKLQLLLQLAICYWQNTRPKTSRKQVSFLEDLLQPNIITERYAKLLKQIS